MLFVYLLLFSIVAIVVIALIENKKSGTSLLQMLKKLCSIDSVRFENHLKKTKDSSRKLKKHVASVGVKYSSKVGSHIESRGNKLRSMVRKRLHSKTIQQETSSFINQIKDH